MDFDIENLQRLLDLEEEITLSGRNIALEISQQNRQGIKDHMNEAMLFAMLQAAPPFIEYFMRPEEEL